MHVTVQKPGERTRMKAIKNPVLLNVKFILLPISIDDEYISLNTLIRVFQKYKPFRVYTFFFDYFPGKLIRLLEATMNGVRTVEHRSVHCFDKVNKKG